MKLDKKARRYGQAIFNVARQTESILPVSESLAVLAVLLKKDALFKVFFQTPKLGPDDRVAVLQKILGRQFDPVAGEFFALLADRKEWKLFIPTVRAYQALQRASLDVLTVKASASEQLDDAAVAGIEKTLKERLDKPVDLTVDVDPELLGGMKLRIGNLFVDGTLQHRLDRMRQNLLQA